MPKRAQGRGLDPEKQSVDQGSQQWTKSGCVCMLSCVWLFVAPWIVVHQAPLSMEFFSENTGTGCHFPFQGIFPTQGLNPCLLCLLHCQAVYFPLAPPGKQGACSCKLPWKLEFDNLLCRFFYYSHMKTIWDRTYVSWSSWIGGRIQGETKFGRFLHLGGLAFPWKPGTHLSPLTVWFTQNDKYLRECPGSLPLPLLPGKGPAGGPRAEAPLWRHS